VLWGAAKNALAASGSNLFIRPSQSIKFPPSSHPLHFQDQRRKNFRSDFAFVLLG
jgi:hypothetical protein